MPLLFCFDWRAKRSAPQLIKIELTTEPSRLKLR